ncbi:hypothetical protein A3D00_02285 [Candidatus Woesebacteria bacterium RIFCSPHIGHO2_02_FULL_38_9]|uniref:Uncharacterized protein n=1 Tax=Candidatus Woesebacteria bacterium RIFCSPHIGHO2_01_FULL_39_28 TaxID=1802496 RepID=A0A1F7YEB5_9BACT|nr:MAG: hypothetical protein A2627_04445 [Candidatus Woesebacteria bacterium RIFCSPHIGHO2_01_FULL_39_28]OGM33418.1 MAG: hypothetical protein A3D00_02285 [Candidatus Woesebacteria bacterium RIFCSPHIGHO2_02_FULL_38_9]OGM57778.1 MAG: hypothetical protein A3A50_05705 [Candidatus Woesebacteria bacterium RIFCSPLOWO2_01_FULL_38_20]
MFKCYLVYPELTEMLTTPKLIRLNLERLFLALEDMVQVELIRNRWKEIKVLNEYAATVPNLKTSNLSFV